MSQVRCVRANNASAMTLDGTRTYLVGDAVLAVIDPGPQMDAHLDAVAAAARNRVRASILLTHDHPDHAAGARALAERLQATVEAPGDGSIIPTDAGDLFAIATPGHTPDHVAYWLESERALFCGDLMMGGLDTALVATPEGDLGQYLASLQRVRALRPHVIYPAHGPDIVDPDAAVGRYLQHREERLRQVVDALRNGPRTTDALVDDIYGAGLDESLRAYAASAVAAYLAHLAAQGQARQWEEQWSLL